MAYEWKPFSPKQLFSIENSTAWLNIWHGAVRSGKTIASLVAWLYFISKSPHAKFMMCGKTRDSLHRNIILDFIEMLNEFGIFKSYNRVDGELWLNIDGKKKVVFLVGMKDESVTGKIQGVTLGGLYCDEITTYPKSAVKMAFSRCSMEGARIFVTTNPESPYHYFYQEYVSNKKLIDEGKINLYHFTLEDNLTLSEEYIENIKASNTGVWYDRYILGLWVLAEGLIYDMFRTDIHCHGYDGEPVTDKEISQYDDFVVGVDYGTSTVCVFGLLGVIKKKVGNEVKNEYHLIKEWYYDAKKRGVQKTDGDYKNKMIEFIGDIHVSKVFIPHDATSFNQELQNAGFKVVMVNPVVKDGIKKVSTLLGSGRLSIHERCVNTIKQMQTYVWDERKYPEEVPKKVDDHSCDMLRYCLHESESFKPFVASIGYW